MKNIVSVLLYLWQLPQNLLGELLLFLYRRKVLLTEFDGVRFYAARRMSGGISLGSIVILSTTAATKPGIYYHEYGHIRQSRRLGWLYLPIVGVQSLIHAALHKLGDYYDFWTERWANNLGGVPGFSGDYVYRTDGRIVGDTEKLKELFDE